MPTLVETVLVLLLLYLVYVHKPPQDGVPIPQPAIHAPDNPLSPVAHHSDERGDAIVEPQQSTRSRAHARAESVFRASTPLRRSESRDLDYEVRLVAEREVDVKPTVDRVFEVDAMMAEDGSPIEGRSPTGPRRGDSVVSYATPRPVAPPKRTASQLPHGLLTPPDSAKTSRTTPRSVSLPAPAVTSPRSIPLPTQAVASPSSASRHRLDVDALDPIPEEEDSEEEANPVATPGSSTRKTRAQAQGTKTASPTTRKVSPSTSDPFKRWHRAFRNQAHMVNENGEAPGTVWYESESGSRILAPPDFSNVADVGSGDVFCHRTPKTCQLWLWNLGEDNLGTWTSVAAGFRRGDGRKLTITPGGRRPSWVL